MKKLFGFVMVMVLAVCTFAGGMVVQRVKTKENTVAGKLEKLTQLVTGTEKSKVEIYGHEAVEMLKDWGILETVE